MRDPKIANVEDLLDQHIRKKSAQVAASRRSNENISFNFDGICLLPAPEQTYKTRKISLRLTFYRETSSRHDQHDGQHGAGHAGLLQRAEAFAQDDPG
jgi:hypothetical protein